MRAYHNTGAELLMSSCRHCRLFGHQECCYRVDGDAQPLITGESGQAGTLTLISDDLVVTDAMAFSFCCGSDENDGLNRYCSSYFSKRPVDDCTDFDAAISGTSSSSSSSSSSPSLSRCRVLMLCAAAFFGASRL